MTIWLSWNDFAELILGLRKDQFYRRLRMARIIRSFPVFEDMILKGETCLTHVAMVHPKLTAKNAQVIAAGICGKSKREVEGFPSSRIEEPGDELIGHRLHERSHTIAPVALEEVIEELRPIDVRSISARPDW